MATKKRKPADVEGLESLGLEDYLLEDHDEIRAEVGARVKQLRGELGYSQAALATVFSKTASWVKQIETGRQWPPPYLVLGLCMVSGRTADWLLGLDGERSKQADVTREMLRAKRLAALRAAGVEGFSEDDFAALLHVAKRMGGRS